MNSANNNNNSGIKCCYSLCSCLTLVTFFILIIIDFANIGSYSQLGSQINSYQYYPNSHSCYEVCGYYYDYQQNGQCCSYYGSTYCTSKNGCIQSLITRLKNQQDGYQSSITALSIISAGLLVMFIVCIRQTCKKPDQNQVPLLENNNYFNINRSQKSSQPTRRIDEKYQSFAYVDQENSCCICLEQFNNEKAILLKCGHIFHSACIRDWAVKQQNCPVCRSSQ